MAINIKTVTCPACGAKVQYDEDHKTTVCEFCGAVLDMTEEYGDKKDRERDDIQDMQIRHIMNNMNGNRRSSSDPNVQKARRSAIIIICSIFGVFFIGSCTIGIVGGVLGRSSAIKDSINNSKLEKTTTEVNPFEKLSISYFGVSGAATGRLSDVNQNPVYSMEKTTTNMEKLSNGDTITVKYVKDSVEKGSTTYMLTETEKTFTVQGLDEYVTDITEVGEEDFEILKKNAINLAISECDLVDLKYVSDSFEVYAIYSMVKKDFSRQQSVFVVSFDYMDEGEQKTGYFMAEYSNVIKHANGEFKINFSAGVFSYGKESYWGGFTVTSAHTKWDSVYTEVYLNNKSEWNVHEDFLG